MARPRKRADSASVLEQATIVADAIHEQDQEAASQSEADRIQRINLPLSRISPRAEDTRPLRDSHVKDLAESIGALGLIEPLVVDTKGILLAGGHRLAAIQLLKETNPELYQQQFPDDLIPVRVMPFDAEAEPERSLQVELAENEKRVNYSRDQIEQLAERLRSLNYRDIPGRPKAGEKALGPALAVAIGVSARYVRRVLAEQTDQYKNTRNSVPNLSKLKALRKIEAALEELISLPESEQPTRAEQSLYKAIPTFLKKVKASLEQESKRH
ncbi:ParB/RepB/Spo0J family partition protein [Chroococcidiopsis sp. TS-821]|uniref:ParB/RepB/Spo0J family partition protein n=1 Tax=Chroococcidiopsis sp. TS-821 TaxID=1378066 RepID=UPI000CEE6B23|nr:ParB/RepB/Spo0J family partition protein [Chroococcidiopsis sp. TS-821]PPS41913.1 chromosome partitioning protein ParB [Chroococcidiopsis sp. TS-821]